MANVLQNSAREAFLTGAIDWSTDTIKIVLLDSGYTYSAAHDFLDDVGAGARVATSSGLSSKTTTDGTADAADYTFAGLTAGDTIVALWIFQDTGVESTSHLIAYFDTDAGSSPISVTTNGGDVEVVFDAGTNKIFRV